MVYYEMDARNETDFVMNVNDEINFVNEEYYDANVMITRINGAVTARRAMASVITLAHGC